MLAVADALWTALKAVTASAFGALVLSRQREGPAAPGISGAWKRRGSPALTWTSGCLWAERCPYHRRALRGSCPAVLVEGAKKLSMAVSKKEGFPGLERGRIPVLEGLALSLGFPLPAPASAPLLQRRAQGPRLPAPRALLRAAPAGPRGAGSTLVGGERERSRE